MRVGSILAAAVLLIGAVCSPLTAQRSAAARAADAVTRGELAHALQIYDSLLAEHPDDLAARVARGHVRSWRRDYPGALEDFRTVHAADSTHLPAWLGAGYVLAWTRQWDRADSAFARATLLAPEAVEPRKGRAWVALWRGDPPGAEGRFGALETEFADDGELPLGRAHALAAQGRRRAARAAYDRALQLGRADATGGIEATRFMPAPLELTVRGGYTRFAGGTPDGANRLALRSVEVAAAPRPAVRLWVIYDNGLAMDNAALAAARAHAPWYAGGLFLGWGGRFGTKLEGGWRALDGVEQWTGGVEQVVALRGGVSVKALGSLGRRSDDRTEWVAGIGLGVPVARRLRVEVTGFTSGNGLPDEDGVRGLLSAAYRAPIGIEVMGGIAAGRTAVDPTRAGSVGEGHLGFTVPVGSHRIHALARHHVLEGRESFTALMVGWTMGLLDR